MGHSSRLTSTHLGPIPDLTARTLRVETFTVPTEAWDGGRGAWALNNNLKLSRHDKGV